MKVSDSSSTEVAPLPHSAVVGLQFGDEGKGQIVDLLSGEHDVIVRYNGGANAGHSVRVGNHKYVLHQLPVGILRPETINVMATGMVVTPDGLFEELDGLDERLRELVFEAFRQAPQLPAARVPHHARVLVHFAIVERVASIIRAEGLPHSTIDGVRVDLDSGWGLIRCSNTTPNLVLRFEAESTEALKTIQSTMLNALKQAEPKLELESLC